MPEQEPTACHNDRKISSRQRIATAANVAMGITVLGASAYGFWEAAINGLGWVRGNVNVPPRPEAPILSVNQDGPVL